MLCLKRNIAGKTAKESNKEKERQLPISKSGPITPIKQSESTTAVSSNNGAQSAPTTPVIPMQEEISHTEMNQINDVTDKLEKVVQITPDRIGQAIDSLMTPALVLDIDRIKANAQAMLKRAEEYGVQLRPHMKAHKTLEGANIMTGGTKRCISVSTLAEAKFYADAGYDDILFAGYLDKDKVEICAEIAEEIKSFHVLLDSYYVIELLRDRPLKDDKVWSVYIGVECRYNGTGVDPLDYSGVGLAVSLTSEPNIFFNGLYVNCENAYSCTDAEAVLGVGQDTANTVINFAKKLRKMKKHKVEFPHVNFGSTPVCSLPFEVMKNVTEWNAGSYIFYDMRNKTLGACNTDDIAIEVLAKVIAHYPNRNQLLIDCGWTALNYQGSQHGHGVFKGHPHLKITSMFQEESKVEDVRGNLDLGRYPIGTILRILPYNACATAALHGSFYIHSKGVVVEEWRPVKGW
ncbi:D-serine dehydratase-like isoform X2 [Ptychodera flava]|uniref:D-serine dehydratase-like isoform X2 n=1 Tax=Ptychodera flava TaxID=63121 RepID=UPI00396A6FB4